MLRFTCQHCHSHLGDFPEGEGEPVCEAHPDGAKTANRIEDYDS